MPEQPGAGPLRGIRVIELGHVASGPFAGLLLADLGADVVKVEPPWGDDMRSWPPVVGEDGATYSHNFAALNRGKRSVIADLKNPEDVSRVRELIGAADVVIENYRVGTLDRLGLGFADVSPGHRGLVYCSISGFGRGSARSNLGAYDVVVQGFSGLMSVNGDPDGPPTKIGAPFGDTVAGLFAALTATAELPRVRETGESVHVDCAMLDGLLATSLLQTSEFWGSGQTPQRHGSAHPRNAPYQVFQASDKPFTLAAGNDRLWQRVCDIVGLEELVTRDEFRTQADRARNQEHLAALLNERFATDTAEVWLERLHAANIPSGPVNTIESVLQEADLWGRGVLRYVDVPVAGATPMTMYPAPVIGREVPTPQAPPKLGEHTDDVLDDWLVRHG